LSQTFSSNESEFHLGEEHLTVSESRFFDSSLFFETA
jgi:hypothetical protein